MRVVELNRDLVGKGGEIYLPGAKDISNAFVSEGVGGVTTWYGLVRCNE